MNKRPLIMISNDDGIDSPGLHASVEALLPLGDILITAPKGQQTAMGRAFKGNPDAIFEKRTLYINGQEVKGWCLEASPATTVRHALQCLCSERWPDMVVSGINYGENIGTNVTASGTIGAAYQAAEWDIKALAISYQVPNDEHYTHSEINWKPIIPIVRKAAVKFLAASWPEDVNIIKIDIPETADETTPWSVSRQSKEPGWRGFVPNATPASKLGTTTGKRAPRPGKSLLPDDDAAILYERKEVSITPLSIDLTSRIALEEVEKLYS